MNVYDFDNTIYDGESLIDFFFFLISKNKKLILYIPLIGYTAVLYKLEYLSIDKLYYLAGKMSSIVINNKENANKFIKEFWEKYQYKLKKEYLNKIRNEDVIITASPDILILGIKNILNTENIICSKFNLDTGKFDFICFRENKAKAFKEKYPNNYIKEFYTDSLNDIVKKKKVKRIIPK